MNTANFNQQVESVIGNVVVLMVVKTNVVRDLRIFLHDIKTIPGEYIHFNQGIIKLTLVSRPFLNWNTFISVGMQSQLLAMWISFSLNVFYHLMKAGIDPPPSNEYAKMYLEENVYPKLLEGLTALCREKPLNPTEWLGNFLVNHSGKPIVEEPWIKLKDSCMEWRFIYIIVLIHYVYVYNSYYEIDF